MNEANCRHPNNLPISLTSFVGRKQESSDVQRLLVTGARLITITGAGGCGKTRLALEVARALAASDNCSNQLWPDGVWFADLSSLAQPDLVPTVVIASLALHQAPGPQPAEALVRALCAKRLLLILDNCEHLLQSCAQLAQTLLSSCPALAILVTSRSPLALPGESIYQVAPLDVLDGDHSATATSILHSESERLFVDRALSAQPDFLLDDGNARAIARICRLLDGIPLAIELAAARVRLLTPRQIAGRLEQAQRLLRNSNSLASARHRSLQASFDWSYGLLTAQERVLFRRLAIFAGPWTLDVAELVIGDEQLPAGDVLEYHERLFDQSLISRAGGGRERQAYYRLLRPIRLYALERLETSAEQASLADRHLAYYTSLAERAWSGFLGPDQFAWFDRIEAEIDDFRAALAWSRTKPDVENGLRLAVALFHFYGSGYVAEGIQVLESQLAADVAQPSLIRARALAFLGLSHLRVARVEAAIAAAEMALNLERSRPDPVVRAYALSALGHAYALKSDYSAAQDLLRQSVMLFREARDIVGLGFALARQGTLALFASDYAAAAAHFEEMAGLMTISRNNRYLHYALRHWAYALLHQGDQQGAAFKLGQELTLFPAGLISAELLVAVASLSLARGRPISAARFLGAAEAILERRHGVLRPYDLSRCQLVLESLRDTLEPAALSVALKTGRRMTGTQAAAELLAQGLVSGPTPGPRANGASGLSEREVEVVALVAQGLTSQQIAQRLFISPRTVHAHLRSIFEKLGVATRTAAAGEAARLGLV